MLVACRHGGLSAVLAGSLLAACATAPIPSPEPTTPTTRTAPPNPEIVKKKPTAKRGGGYYQDDGPDDNPPDNLDNIPDAAPQAEPLHRYANNPYNVFGVDYVPSTELKPYKVRGVASWYGKKFHGQRTSSGETYDMYGMTAAHPTLPIPSYARVTNVSNGKSVVVRINDRGPFHSSRVIDLSYTAAYKLGYIERGSTEVEVETIIPEGVELIAANVPPIKQRPARNAPPKTATRTIAPKPQPAPAPSPDPVSTIAMAETPSAMVAATPSNATATTRPTSSVPQIAPATPPAANITLAATDIAPAASKPSALGIAAATGTLAARTVFLQLGSFNTARNAEGFRTLVETELSWLSDKLEVLSTNGRFRLHAGPFNSDAEARKAANRIAAALRLKPFVVLR